MGKFDDLNMDETLDDILKGMQERSAAHEDDFDYTGALRDAGEQPNDRSAPPDVMPSSITGFDPNEGIYKGPGNKALSWLMTAGDTFTFGLRHPMSALMYGPAHAVKNIKEGVGGDGLWEQIKSGFSSEYSASVESGRQNRENIGPFGGLLADTAGSVAPGSLAVKADQALAKSGRSMAEIVAPRAYDRLARVGQNAASAGATNALQAYLNGDTGMDDFVLNGGLGVLFGGAGQALIGERALPMLQQIQAKSGPAYGEVLKRMSSSGADQSGISLNSLAGMVDDPMFGGSLMTQKIGSAPIWKQWAKLNDIIADTAFRKFNPRKLNTEEGYAAMERYRDLNETIGTYRRQVNDDIMAEMTLAIDAPASRYDALVNNDKDLRDARTIMKRMSTTVPTPDNPNPLGAQMLNTADFLDTVESMLPRAYGRRDLGESPASARKMYALFNDKLRGLEQEGVARDFRKIPSQGKDAPQAEDIFADVPLARLMDARQEFSAELSPAMAFAKGTSPADLKAGVEILKMIDQTIDEYTNGAAGMARGAFAKAKTVEEAYDMGQKFYSQRLTEFKDSEDFTKFYGEHLNTFYDTLIRDNPKAAEAFAAGFRKAMLDKVGSRSFMAEMKYFVGDFDPRVPKGTVNTKSENLKTMEKILGKKDTNKILDIYFHGDALDKNTKLLADALIEKGENPAAATKMSGLARGTISLDDENPALLRENLKPAIKYLFTPGDRRVAEAAIDMMTARDENLRGILKTGLIQATGGMPRDIGTRFGTIMTPDLPEEQNKDELRSYLEQTYGINRP